MNLMIVNLIKFLEVNMNEKAMSLFSNYAETPDSLKDYLMQVTK